MISKFNELHPITKNFKGQVFFPLVSSIQKINNNKGRASLLVETSPFPASWGENDLNEFISGVIKFNLEQDLKGPLGLLGAWESVEGAAKMIVAGNSTFVINTYSKFSKNYSLFLSSLNWLVGEERLISLNLPTAINEPVFVSAPQLGIIFYFSVVFSPLFLSFIAFLMYRRRVKL